MSSFSYILLFLTMAAVAGVLFWGILTMARGGEYNINWSNTIMRWRIILQALALAIFVLILLFSR
ncbi:MAG: twin transmembrane helix small protein [Candidatus Puniceispirillales bacterium]|jgi:hypothetical protein|nr:twin transmembrane helix small protein [Pseudomonadota bacterium]